MPLPLLTAIGIRPYIFPETPETKREKKKEKRERECILLFCSRKQNTGNLWQEGEKTQISLLVPSARVAEGKASNLGRPQFLLL